MSLTIKGETTEKIVLSYDKNNYKYEINFYKRPDLDGTIKLHKISFKDTDTR